MNVDHAWDEPPPKESSIRAWIGVIAASLLLLGGYTVLRDRLNPPPETVEEEAVADTGETKRSSPKRKKRRQRTAEADEYESGDDFVVDDREFRDLIAEGKAEEAALRNQESLPEEPEFVPPPEMYQPNGPYSPVASYREPGARDDVVTLDLSSNADEGGPLETADVKRVLNVSSLMPCYDPVVQKVPQMRGRVRMRFVIAPDGHVMEATVTDSDLRSRTVETCIVNKARRFRFPSTTQKTKFTTHFDFSSR